MPTPEFKVGDKIVTLVIRFKSSITPRTKGDDPVNDPVSDPVSDPVKGVLKEVFEIIKNNPGILKPSIAVASESSNPVILE